MEHFKPVLKEENIYLMWRAAYTVYVAQQVRHGEKHGSVHIVDRKEIVKWSL
jgi:hypothetical protein